LAVPPQPCNEPNTDFVLDALLGTPNKDSVDEFDSKPSSTESIVHCPHFEASSSSAHNNTITTNNSISLPNPNTVNNTHNNPVNQDSTHTQHTHCDTPIPTPVHSSAFKPLHFPESEPIKNSEFSLIHYPVRGSSPVESLVDFELQNWAMNEREPTPKRSRTPETEARKKQSMNVHNIANCVNTVHNVVYNSAEDRLQIIAAEMAEASSSHVRRACMEQEAKLHNLAIGLNKLYSSEQTQTGAFLNHKSQMEFELQAAMELGVGIGVSQCVCCVWVESWLTGLL